MEEKQTKLFNDCDAFFAFSNRQFLEQRKPGIMYVRIDHGLICNKEKAEQLISGLETIWQEALNDDFQEHGAERIIEREYFNHEIQITQDVNALFETLEAYIKMFPSEFTREKILKVNNLCFKKAVENDWF